MTRAARSSSAGAVVGPRASGQQRSITVLGGQLTTRSSLLFEGIAWPSWAARKLQGCTNGSALHASPVPMAAGG